MTLYTLPAWCLALAWAMAIAHGADELGCTGSQQAKSDGADHVRAQCQEHDMAILLQQRTTIEEAIVARLAHKAEAKPSPEGLPPAPVYKPEYNIYSLQCAVVVGIVLLLMVYLLRDEGNSLGRAIATPSGRLDLLDNAKFFLVALVILHHTCLGSSFGLARHWPWSKAMFHSLCPLHVSTLCFMSGLVSRGALKVDKLMVSLIAPLVAYCIVLAPIFTGFADGRWHLFSPGACLFYSGSVLQWYLIALIWWRILGAMLLPFKASVRIIAAFVMAAMASYISTHVLAFSKSLNMFPIFVAGQLFPWDKALSALQWRPITATVGILLVVSFELAILCSETADGALLDPMKKFLPHPDVEKIAWPVEMPFFWLSGFARTLLEILKAIVFSVVVCPRTHCCVTDLGRYSLYAYLLHPPVLHLLDLGFQSTPWLRHLSSAEPALQALTTVMDTAICVGLCALLSSWPVRAVFGVLLEPTWIKRLYANDGEEKSKLATEVSLDGSKPQA